MQRIEDGSHDIDISLFVFQKNSQFGRNELTFLFKRIRPNRFVMLLPIACELLYLGSSLASMPPLFITMVAFPAVLVFPGLMFLAILRRGIDSNLLEFAVEGFFISTLMTTILTSIFLTLGYSLTPFDYSIVTTLLVSTLTMIGFAQKIDIKPGKSDILLLTLASTAFVLLISCFSTFPRLFAPDETSYIFSARMGVSGGVILPMGVRPDVSGITVLLGGRYLWTYLLSSFLGSAGLPAYQAGLFGVGFLIMTAIASSLLVKSKYLSIVVFVTVLVSPLLLSFSVLSLNDLAISFYAVFAVLFFVKSFIKTGESVSINITNLSYSLIGIVVLALVKQNLLIFVVMWIVLVGVMVKYRLYRSNRRHKILFLAILLPVLIYELCVDLPYVISVWILGGNSLSNLLGKFLFISPIEKFSGWFAAPWWNPTASTFFSHNSVDYLDYFYRILSPEHSFLIISAVVLSLPFLIRSRHIRKELDTTVLALLLLLSLGLFYLDAVSSASLNDASRYSLWMIPLWIPLGFMVLKDMIETPSFRTFLPVIIAASSLFWINTWLSAEKGGVEVGYSLSSRILTADVMTIQLVATAALLSLLFLRKNLVKAGSLVRAKLSLPKTANMKNLILASLVVLMLLSEFYFNSQFLEKSQLYANHGFTAINNASDNFTGANDLYFANNYIYMRPYVSDKLIQQGLLLPPPDTKDDFLRLLDVAPNNTMFLISDNDDTTWYEYANNYIKNYSDIDAITPEKPAVSIIPRLNLANSVLNMTFDDANGTTIMDHSGLTNNGENHGATQTEGYYGQALRFDGSQYISVQNKDPLNVQNALTISFFASIKEANSSKGYMILSKGYAPENGSYDIFVWDGKIYFSLGEVGSLSIDAEPYVGTWHQFIFTYDGEKMEMYVDGSPKASEHASGLVRATSYNLEIGRDSERGGYYFIGSIDELQISNTSISSEWLVNQYYSNYALRICEIPLPKGEASLSRVVSRNNDTTQDIAVMKSSINVDENRTVTVEVQIDSSESKNVTILIATDRFMKVYETPVTPGLNDASFKFDYVIDSSWYEAGGLYWLHLAQARVVVIEDGNLAYNEFVTALDLRSTNSLLLILLLAILALYSLIQFKRIIVR